MAEALLFQRLHARSGRPICPIAKSQYHSERILAASNKGFIVVFAFNDDRGL